MSDHQTNLVVVGIIVRDGKVFIARRAKTKQAFPNVFELVGGHLDLGEQPTEALKREIMEEIGVEVEVLQPVDAFTYDYEDQFKVEICYLCRLKDPTVELTLNPADHSESRWIRRDEIDQYERENEETEALRKAFKILEGEKL